MLCVRDISAVSDEGIVSDWKNTLHIFETCKTSKAGQIVCSEDDAVFVFHAQYTCANNFRLLSMLNRRSLRSSEGMEGRLDRLHWVYA
jgi:hypothetical protein